MRLYLKFVHILIKSVEFSDDEKKRKKIFNTAMALIAVFGIILPVSFFVGVVVYTITGGLTQLGGQEQGIALFLHLISAFSFVFGLNVIYNVFYFSADVESILPLPLKPYQIVSAKFTAALISENIMQFMIVFAAIVGYIFAMGLPIWSWLVAILCMLTLPIIPMVYCGVIALVTMYFTHFIKNKDRVNKLTGVLTLLIILGIVLFCGNMSDFSTNSITQAIANDNSLLNVMNIILPHIRFIVSGVSGDIIGVVIYLAINIVAVVVFLLLAELMYFKGIVGIGGSGSAKQHSVGFRKAVKGLKEKEVSLSYFKKELLILVRTPAYFMNCIVINLVWPILLYLVYALQGPDNFLGKFFKDLSNGNATAGLIFAFCASGISVLITSANSIASSSITREGSHFAFMKYIPIDFMTQINIKASVAILISGLGMIIYVIIAGILFSLNGMFVLFTCLISLFSVVSASYFGIYMDSINPKLVWDDEVNALRGNYNIFYNMALSILLVAVLCAIAYLLFSFVGVSEIMLEIGLMITLVVFCKISYLLCKTRATKNIYETVA